MFVNTTPSDQERTSSTKHLHGGHGIGESVSGQNTAENAKKVFFSVFPMFSKKVHIFEAKNRGGFYRMLHPTRHHHIYECIYMYICDGSYLEV